MKTVFWRIILVGAFSLATCQLAHAETTFLKSGEQIRLGPHFTAKEFECHDCRVKKVNSILIYKLELLRIKLGGRKIKITSGYRCPSHNKKVGGVTKSQHMAGKAADIQIFGVSPKDVATAAQAVGFSFVKVYKHHTHVDVR